MLCLWVCFVSCACHAACLRLAVHLHGQLSDARHVASELSCRCHPRQTLLLLFLQDAATTIGAPPNLYISSQPLQDKHSGKQQQAGNQKLRISGTVGQTMEVQLVVGLQGLQDTRIEGVKLSGSLQGTQLISVAEPDATTPGKWCWLPDVQSFKAYFWCIDDTGPCCGLHVG